MRKLVGISGSAAWERAYGELVEWEFDAARRGLESNISWIGNVGPRSVLHSMDKYLWWKGGGDKSGDQPVKDPWEVIRRLNIDCSKFD